MFNIFRHKKPEEKNLYKRVDVYGGNTTASIGDTPITSNETFTCVIDFGGGNFGGGGSGGSWDNDCNDDSNDSDSD